MTTSFATRDEAQAWVDELEAELSNARAEIEVLRTTPELQPIPVRSKHRMRRTASGTLIVLSALLSVIALLSVWVSTTVLDTDRYVDTVAPLATNAAVQSTVAERVTNQIFSQVDVATAVKSALPPNGQALAAPLTSQLHGFVENQIKTVMGTPAFSNAWKGANRVTQAQLSALLLNKGDNRVLTNENGTVSLDLHALVTTVLDNLKQAGVTVFEGASGDKVKGTVELFQSSDLANASATARALHTARYLAPILLLGAIAAAVALATNRRRATGWLGFALATGMLGVAGLIVVGRHVVVSQAANVGLPSDTATQIYDTLTRFLERSNEVLFVLAIIVMLTAVFTGPGRAALWLKRGIRSNADRLAGAVEPGEGALAQVGRRLGPNVVVARATTIVLAVLLLWAWSSPTITVLLTIVALTLAVLFAIEVLGAVGRRTGRSVHPPGVTLPTVN